MYTYMYIFMANSVYTMNISEQNVHGALATT